MPRNKTLKKNPLSTVETVVLRGGGAKGIVYLSAIEAIRNYKVNQADTLANNIIRVSGSSAGAITGALIAVDAPQAQVDTLCRLKFTDLLDNGLTRLGGVILNPFATTKGLLKKLNPFAGTQEEAPVSGFRPIVHETVTLESTGGLDSGEVLYNRLRKELIDAVLSHFPDTKKTNERIQTLETMISQTANAEEADELQAQIAALKKVKLLIHEIKHSTRYTLKFKDLHLLHQAMPETFKDLYVTGTRITENGEKLKQGVMEMFSHETYPEMEVALAVRISAGFPTVFKRVKFEGELYHDGGAINNFPADYFYDEDAPENELRVIGFGCENDLEYTPVTTETLETPLSALGRFVSNIADRVAHTARNLCEALAGDKIASMMERGQLAVINLPPMSISTLTMAATSEQQQEALDVSDMIMKKRIHDLEMTATSESALNIIVRGLENIFNRGNGVPGVITDLIADLTRVDENSPGNDQLIIAEFKDTARAILQSEEYKIYSPKFAKIIGQVSRTFPDPTDMAHRLFTDTSPPAVTCTVDDDSPRATLPTSR